jgi:hypothetical protein
MIELQQAILLKLQANQQKERMLAYIAFWVEIPMRRAHHVVEEGAPSGREWAAKCGMRAATSPISKTHVQSKTWHIRARHLSKLWAATSRVRHLSKRGALSKKHMLKSSYHIINQPSIKSNLFPLTISLTFVLLFCL